MKRNYKPQPALVRALAQEVNLLLKRRNEVVLATADLQTALSDGQFVDAVEAMRVLRKLSDHHAWESFVFDHGALVRIRSAISRKHRKASAPSRPRRG